MNVVIIILLHFLVYIIPPALGSFLKKEVQIYLNYTYLGILFCFTQLFDSLYAVILTDEFNLNGGDISYSALIFTTVYLIVSQPEPKVVRNLIYIIMIIGIFWFFFLILIHSLLEYSPNISNYLNISGVFLEFSYRSLLFSFFLYGSEIILILWIVKKFLVEFKRQFWITLGIVLTYYIVLLLDGIAYPIGMNILFPGNNFFSVKYGIFAKVIFGAGFGFSLFILLNIQPGNYKEFIIDETPLLSYIIPPRRNTLKEQLQKAEDELNILREILPICSRCKKIRDDEGYWNQLEAYLLEHQNVVFTHGLCPDCAKKEIKEFEAESNH